MTFLSRSMAAASVFGLCLAGAPGAQASGPTMDQVRNMAYDGQRARIAVARFENKAGGQRWYSPQIGDGMADMLTTALFETGAFIVLERQALDEVLVEQDLIASGRVRQGATTQIDQLEDAELLVVAAVTEFDDNSGGTRGSVGGGRLGRAIGAVTSGMQSAHMAIDLRIIETQTGRVLAATSVEGEARDFDVGGALSGYTSRHALGGSLSHWQNTPREKALRQVIGEAVEFVVTRTPDHYYRHTGHTAAGQPVAAAETGDAAPSGGSGERVVVISDLAQVRQAPSDGSATQFELSGGSIVHVTLRAQGWVQITDDQGRKGWLPEDQVLAVR